MEKSFRLKSLKCSTFDRARAARANRKWLLQKTLKAFAYHNRQGANARQFSQVERLKRGILLIERFAIDAFAQKCQVKAFLI